MPHRHMPHRHMPHRHIPYRHISPTLPSPSYQINLYVNCVKNSQLFPGANGI